MSNWRNQPTTLRINEINCTSKDQNVIVTIYSDGMSLTFHSTREFPSGFSDTIWYGEDHFSLCHHLTGMRTVVRYKASADTTYAGDISSWKFVTSFQRPLEKPSYTRSLSFHLRETMAR